MRRFFLPLSLLSLGALSSTGCVLYDGPPQPRIDGAEAGVLTDPDAPLTIAFSEPVDPATVRVSVVRLVTDVEGNLGDEDADPDTDLDVLFSYDPVLGNVGGDAALDESNTHLVIDPAAPMPIGPKLAVLVEEGLSDLGGHKTTVRKRLLFSYKFELECNKPSVQFPSGGYFLLADIKSPLKVQVQLWASFEVDPATGKVRGQATNADRNPDKSRCNLPCKSSEVCRLLPAPACVAPSERAGTADEYSDYIPNPTPPTGYSFTIDGCAQDQPDGSVVFVTAPVDVVVQSPPVTLRNVTLTAQLGKDAEGVLRGSGSLAADSVLIGTTPSGKGEGGLVLRNVPPGEVPEDIPKPPPAP